MNEMANRKAIDYLILEAENRLALIRDVQDHVNLGFEPIGAVVITKDSKEGRLPRTIHTFYQTLVKYRIDN